MLHPIRFWLWTVVGIPAAVTDRELVVLHQPVDLSGHRGQCHPVGASDNTEDRNRKGGNADVDFKNVAAKASGTTGRLRSRMP
ncbi:hypothetical protein ABZ848_45125 [Streptomyces sp. NPDC047081]|uniref:hypothetical protein n=1 Tax=Streptomyces sp. NPDC047081 TaxID=3154706 RepID=UPI00340FA45D